MKLIRSAPLTGGGTVSGDLTVEGDFVVEGGGSLTVDHAVTGNATLTSATTWSPVLKLDNTNADATSAKFQFFKSATASEADDDYIGLIDFWGVDDGDAATRYAYIAGITSDVTGGTEDGRLEFHTIGNATEAARLILDANSRISLSNNDLGGSNTVFGNLAGAGIISGGDSNSLFGDAAGKNLTTGAGNVAIGFQTLDQATTETDNNVAIGYQAMHGSITTEAVNDCVAIGSNALDGPLEEEVSGTVAIGKAALGALTDGARNTSIGYQSMLTGQSSGDNTMVGYNTGYQMGTGSLYNTVLGSKAFSGNQTNNDSNYCVAIGYLALSGALDSITNGAVAIGGNALQALTTGGSNVGIGFYALKNLTEGSDNTAIGHNAFSAAGAGESNNIAIGSAALGLADEGTGSGNAIDGNIAIGKDALSAADFGSTGSRTLLSNIAIGNNALNSTSTNSMTGTIAIGEDALTALTSGARNTAIGYEALKTVDSTESNNTAIGYQSMTLLNDDDNNSNTAIGSLTMSGIVAGGSGGISDCVAIGHNALLGTSATSEDGTIAIGKDALKNLTTGAGNVAVGCLSGQSITGGSNNTAVGYTSMGEATGNTITGDDNTAIGNAAGFNLEDGANSNTFVGSSAGEDCTTASLCTVIGFGSEPSAVDGSHETVIGNAVTGKGTNTVTLGNANVTDVYMNQNGSNGTGADVHAKQFKGYGLAATQAETVLTTYTDTATNFSLLRFYKSNQDTVGNTATVDNDDLGGIVFGGNTGSAFATSVAIYCKQDGSVSGSNVPGDFDIHTNNGSVTESRFLIANDGTLTASASNDISDQELKENIEDVENGLDTIKKLQGRTFTWKETAGMQSGTKYGLIAQELEKVLPDLVYDKNGIREKEDGTYYKSIQMTGIIPVLIEAVKELSAEVEKLKNNK